MVIKVTDVDLEMKDKDNKKRIIKGKHKQQNRKGKRKNDIATTSGSESIKKNEEKIPVPEEGPEVVKPGSTAIRATKRHLDEIWKSGADTQPDPDFVEEESKKAKSTVDEGVLESLADCDLILASSNASPGSKIHCLIELFQSILDKNVNIVMLSEDFPSWVKNAVSIVLKDVTQVSAAFFNVLTLAIKVAPTVFESLLEGVLKVSLFFPRVNLQVQESCDIFMEFIVNTFEKLRRFPKFIAKFLCCVRDNLKVDCQTFGAVICPKFTAAIGSVINQLTVGQITDLWKTLQHNLEVECIKPLMEGNVDENRNAFLCIVVDLFAEFLSNIKVTDYTIPGATVEKISEMMEKLREECLKPFGLFISTVSTRGQSLVLVKQYLNLAYAFGQLHGILLCYNAKYKGNKPLFDPDSTDAADLSYLHPYMDGESWIHLSSRTLKCKDSTIKQLMVNLVAQKLTFMTALEKKFSNPRDILLGPSGTKEITNDNGRSFLESQEIQLKDAAEFIWTHHNKHCIQFSDETLTLISQYIEPTKIIELAGTCIQQLQDEGKFGDMLHDDGSSSVLTITGNPTFHYALILESLGEIMRRVQKMKLLSKPLKSILNEVLTVEAKTTLITEFSFTRLKISQNQKCSHAIMRSLLTSLNSILESTLKSSTAAIKVTEGFSSQLINGMLMFLCGLDLETYPKDVKTVVFLCSFVVLVALFEQHSDSSALESVSKLVVAAGCQSQGNEIVFSVHWVHLFQWYTNSVDRFSPSTQLNFCNMILSNVFMSPKFMAEFEEEIRKMCDVESPNSPAGHISLTCLEFLLKELQTKTKLNSQLQDHCGKLTYFIVRKLDEMDESIFYRACWLIQLAVDRMDDETLKIYKSLLASKIKKTLKYLKASSAEQVCDNPPVVYAIRFLHAVCKSQTKLLDALPSEFLNKLWRSCLNPNVMQYDGQLSLQSHKLKMPKNFVKDIFEAANPSDFQLICNSLLDRTTSLAATPHNFKVINMIVQILAEFVDAELSSENKPIRRHTLQECLHKILLLTLEWDVADDTCLNSAILPYLKLQTKVLRRRGAIVNLKTLAVCLTSVTSISLGNIKDSATFKIVFCTLAELMNALIVHRLDVVAFRSHIFLQCFQYLIEGLARRADQKNKLSDGEILNVRTCGHSIERLCQSMKLGKKELSRVSPYFITVLIKQFELLAVYPAVKVPLLGGCYKLLDLCDEHGISQLNSLLTIGSKEILKTIYDQYKKFYQYKGRV